MDKKKAMRITIDGYANTGKTLLAWKIAEFLKLHGVDGANITFFNDNVEQLTEDPIELERILNDATSRDMWKDMEVALVERTPPRLAKWAAKPETYSPVLMSNDHINLEMGRNKRDVYLERKVQNASLSGAFAKQPESAADRDRQEVTDQLRYRGLEPTTLQDVRDWLDSTGKVVPVVSVSTMYAMRDNWDALRLQLTTLGEPMSERTLSIARTVLWGSALSLDQALRRNEALMGTLGSEWSSAEVMERHYGLGREINVQSMTAEQVATAGLSEDGVVSVTPDVARSLASMMGFADEMAHLKEAALHPELTIADGEAAVSYSGTVLGHPVSIPARRLHSYGNYTPEELAKYKPQVHPTTGETREQMYERSAAGREAKMNEDGQVGISFKGLPRDLVFDPRCGVRWYTEEELAKEGMRYPNVLEFKHSGARLMPNVTEPTTQPGAQVVRGGDGAVLMTWVPTDAPSDGKAPDPALEPRREERDSALNQRLHEAARNLGNITELGISGRVELPKSED